MCQIVVCGEVWKGVHWRGGNGERISSLLSLSIIQKVAGLPGGSVGKESACNVGNLCLTPGLGRSPGGGHGNPLQYSSWRTSWTEVSGRLQSMGLQRVGHN